MFLMQQKEMDEKAVNKENGKKLWQLSQALIDSIMLKDKIQEK